RNVRPWGFWGPIREKVMAEDPSFQPNQQFKRDAFNVLIGIIWQTALVILPIYLVLLQTVPVLLSLLVAVVCSLILKKT
ncbi:MAG: sodium:solute symporter, partial [Phaeodactylibacter sp.]|nr:sodium:solute symporter [Phaeodactylibacter sp.]